jgi:hypothetical protein
MLSISPKTYAPLSAAVQASPLPGLQADLLARIRGAAHLVGDTPAVEALVVDLMRSGHTFIPDTQADRFRAVSGVQWAMETTLNGPEFIVTAQRATPLRTHGDTPQSREQAIRRAGLIERLELDRPIHLVFCADGVGTKEQDAAYQRDILARFGSQSGKPILHEHALPITTTEFPSEASGAFIFTHYEAELFAFAIKASQADQSTQSHGLEMFFGRVVAPTNGSGGNALTHRLAWWSQTLKDWCDLDCMALAGHPQAP